MVKEQLIASQGNLLLVWTSYLVIRFQIASQMIFIHFDILIRAQASKENSGDSNKNIMGIRLFFEKYFYILDLFKSHFFLGYTIAWNIRCGLYFFFSKKSRAQIKCGHYSRVRHHMSSRSHFLPSTIISPPVCNQLIYFLPNVNSGCNISSYHY